ncbi:MAG TPA: FAD-dependent oxidoreductase [Streptosporangiaceae bacterium]|nr:FAD-dependent oxidoreductase [Streptosporangiaceae bacterium]
MPAGSTFVIVGASLAGAKAAETLRDEGFDGRIVLIGAEPHHPYERPALSKDYLQGRAGRETIFVHDDAWYAEHSVDLRLGTEVTGVDRSQHRVTLAGGESVGYDKLLLTTGAAPVRLPVPGTAAEGVRYLRTVDDSERLRADFAASPSVAVIGAGWIGLEVAAAARNAGCPVTVLEAAELPLLRVLGPEVARIFADLHAEHQVDLRLGVQVSAITAAGDRVGGVRLDDATEVGADVVVVGIGVRPEVRLAEEAGLEVRDGIVTDAALRTSDPDIHAAGDVASAFHPLLGRHIRVEHWANALNQPPVAARAMLGQDVSYETLPFFFSDQYDLGLEYAGYVEPGGYDQVVFRGDVGTREFIAFWLAKGRLLAGMNVNIWDVSDQIQQIIAADDQVDPGLLADPGVPLAETVIRR